MRQRCRARPRRRQGVWIPFQLVGREGTVLQTLEEAGPQGRLEAQES